MDEPKNTPCFICGRLFDGWGHNPEPFGDENTRCCGDCNDRWVVPIRMIQGRRDSNKRLLQICIDIARHANFMISTREFIEINKERREKQLKRMG